MFSSSQADHFFDCFRKGYSKRLHQGILMTLEDFNKKVYVKVSRAVLDELDFFLDVLFNLFREKNFVLGQFTEKYFQYITLLENLTFLSSFKSTEAIFHELREARCHETQKILLLHNLKNSLDFNLLDSVFKQNSALGSYWLYSVYTRHCFCNDTVLMNLLMLQNKLLGYDLYPFAALCSVYFNATYINPENHMAVRKKVNEAIRKYVPLPAIKNTSRENKVPKIGIVSKNWNKKHAVYTCIGSFIESLRDTCALSLIELNPQSRHAQFDYFTDVFFIKRKGNFIDYSAIADNSFNMIIFPDIGLNIESLILSNLRIAPVQISMYGHPVSTASEMVDYFLVGELSETKNAASYYTEAILPIKGTGMNSVLPGVKRPTFDEKSGCLDGTAVNIFVSSSSPKINSTIKQYWKKIADTSSRPVVLHLLPGDYGFQETSVMRRELKQFIGKERIRIHRHKETAKYLDVIQRCDFAIGSYHYGDYNRVVDSLWMGTPIIVIRGTCGYQNTGVGALRAAGLDELIAEHLDAYVELALELIADDETRRCLQRKILRLDIEKLLIHNRDYITDFTSSIHRIVSKGV